jgi:phospholipid-transporting ATPase
MTQIFPTATILIIAILREGIEDYRRYQSDSVTNGRKVRRVNTDGSGLGIIETIDSADVRDGDTLMIVDEEEFPADIILIKS